MSAGGETAVSDGASAEHGQTAAGQRVLGFELAPHGLGRHHRDGPEPQRVLGFPATWLEDRDATWLGAFSHPFQALRALARRRLER